jgi:DNA 3'-phosphatase
VKILFSIFLFVIAAHGETQTPKLNRTRISPNFFPTRRPGETLKIPVAFFDADSTLRVTQSGTPTPNSPDDFAVLPNVEEKIAELNRRGYFVAIVSNQGGVPEITSLEAADSALFNLQKKVKQGDAEIHYFDFAEHEDKNRKPGIEMAKRLETKLIDRFNDDGPVRIDWKNSIMVGDAAYKKGETRPDGRPGKDFNNSDRLFAEALGIKFIEPADFFGWREAGIDRMDKRSDIDRYRTFTREKCAKSIARLR